MDKKVKLPSEFIDLGESPSMPLELEDNTSKSMDYPSLYFSGKDSLKDLPESGMACIHYKKVMESETKTTSSGESKTKYSVELQIHGIKPMNDMELQESEYPEEADDEDAIEEGLNAASKAKPNKK